MRWIRLDEPNTSMLLFASFCLYFCTVSYSFHLCVHVMVIAIEGEQFEPEFEAEAEEPLPEIFDQQEFVPEGKSCSTTCSRT